MAKRTLKATAVSSLSALALAAAGQAGAVDFQTGDTTVSIYGYAIGKVSYDFEENLGDATAANANSTVDDPANEGFTEFDATQSRIGFQTTTEVGGSDLVTKIEGDFRSGGNFRLRHGYGEWNGILAGQTWSNFTTFVGYTPTVDFNGPPGNAGYLSRYPQVRYTVNGFSVALEQPQQNVMTGGVSRTTKDGLPAVSARYEGSVAGLAYAVAGIAREVEITDVAGTAADEGESAMGYGALAALSYDFGPVTLRGNVTATEGANNYLYHSGVGFWGTDAYVDSNGDLETVGGYGGTIGASIDAGPGTVNVVYGTTMMDDTDQTGDNETQSGAFVNYQWSPANRISYGVEYAYLAKETADVAGQSNPDGSRISAAMQYSF